jgi:hypothetical protein
VAQEVRLRWTLKWPTVLVGSSWASQVSVCGCPGPPLTHSVSRLAGV